MHYLSKRLNAHVSEGQKKMPIGVSMVKNELGRGQIWPQENLIHIYEETNGYTSRGNQQSGPEKPGKGLRIYH